MESHDLGDPLHSLVICAKLSPEEQLASTSLQKVAGTKGTSKGELYLVGMGLSVSDVTIKGQKALCQCDVIYVDERYLFSTAGVLEAVTALSGGKAVSYCSGLDSEVLCDLKDGKKVGIVVGGDPLILSDYCSSLSSVTGCSVKVAVVHNTSILNSVGSCGLQLYSFGETLLQSKTHSIVDKLIRNVGMGMHSLILLAQSKESTDCHPSIASLFESLGSHDTLCHCKYFILVYYKDCSLHFRVTDCSGLSKYCKCEGKLVALVVAKATHPLEDEYVKSLPSLS